MARGDVHTVHRDGVWINEAEGEGELSRHRTREEAAATGRSQAMARRSEHLIHRLDGTIGERNSYGGDPFPPRG
jgi:Uncharacterized protein conserved in bacteria (DUF2188)